MSLYGRETGLAYLSRPFTLEPKNAGKKMGSAIRFFELNTGAKMPSVGLGTYRSDAHLVGDVLTSAVKVSPSVSSPLKLQC